MSGYRKGVLTGEWLIAKTTARQRRVAHYWLTILWFTIGTVVWVVLRESLWFVGLMAGWAAETPVEHEEGA